MTSHPTRRSLILIATTAAGVLATAPSMLSALGQTPQPLPSPNAPNQNVPAGLDSTEIIKPQRAPPNIINQQQIGASVQQLYALALELKDEVEHTNLHNTLPLDFVKKAQQIEKLAKQIKERAKG